MKRLVHRTLLRQTNVHARANGMFSGRGLWRWNRRERFVVFYADDYRRGSLRLFRKRAERDNPAADDAVVSGRLQLLLRGRGCGRGRASKPVPPPVLTVRRRITIKTARQTKAGTIIPREISSRFSSNCHERSLRFSSIVVTRTHAVSLSIRALWPEHAPPCTPTTTTYIKLFYTAFVFVRYNFLRFPFSNTLAFSANSGLILFSEPLSRVRRAAARAFSPPPTGATVQKNNRSTQCVFPVARAIIVPRPKTSWNATIILLLFIKRPFVAPPLLNYYDRSKLSRRRLVCTELARKYVRPFTRFSGRNKSETTGENHVSAEIEWPDFRHT